VKATTVAAGLLTSAAAAMAAAAFLAGGDDGPAVTAGVAAQEPAAVREGKAVWIANGCGSCHTFAAASARGEIGPDLAASLKGMPASYIRQSIVAPSEATAPGYTGGMMPEDYGARIPPAELERLVAFIRAGVPD
jgi:cytochrome c553